MPVTTFLPGTRHKGHFLLLVVLPPPLPRREARPWPAPGGTEAWRRGDSGGLTATGTELFMHLLSAYCMPGPALGRGGVGVT